MKFFLALLFYLVPLFVLAAPTSLGAASPPSLVGALSPNLTPATPAASSSTPGFAIDQFNFTPPVGDYSVIFLGNIFGIVDGVLHGTGSQMLGQIFGVFNAAVMALGGILVIYTTTVSTMNTAHEGQFLGQKWSSIWVPLRSVIGISLLVPKASGYCIMQIFIMWVVVQGVGAADRIWNVALEYLNRGGVLVQQQISHPVAGNLLGSSGLHQIEDGAYHLLQAQVCMLTLHKALKSIKEMAETQASSQEGICYTPAKGSLLEAFCNTPIPDFLGAVNAVSFQESKINALAPGASPPTQFSLELPYFDPQDTSIYVPLKKICGVLHWNNVSTTSAVAANSNLSASDLNTITLSRAIAVQQLYQDLSVIALKIVDNLPFFHSQADQANAAIPFLAMEQFGIPLDDTGAPCSGEPNCTSWGPDPSVTLPTGATETGALFNGMEFKQAIDDYNAVMLPTLRMLAAPSGSMTAATTFIQQAEASGWIMAGSYFFNIVQLNAQSMAANVNADTDSGLQTTIGPDPIEDMLQNLQAGSGCTTVSCICSKFQHQAEIQICNLANGQLDFVGVLGGVLDGKSPQLPSVTPPATPLNLAVATRPPFTTQQGALSSTLYGFVNNALMMTLPGQPGQTPPKFAMKMNIQLQTSMLQLPNITFPCGRPTFFVGCVGRILSNILYNTIIKTVYNSLIQTVLQVVNMLISMVLMIPLQALAQIFIQGVSTIEWPSVNPIVALANMGVTYINFATNLWIDIMGLSMAASLVPWFGLVVYMLLALVAPILGTWVVIMTGIGFTTAYYVPLLPYMIFTFGSIAWIMVVLEAMVAAPIVALGVSSPEGDQAFGKAEPAVMLLMNVFLRPAMMIVGYISAIAISYVSVWVINAGFANAILFIQGNPSGPSMTISMSSDYTSNLSKSLTGGVPTTASTFFVTGGSSNQQTVSATAAGKMHMNNGYPGWAGVYGLFFCILMYTTMYLTVVQQAFNFIVILPDKILRWISGQQETLGAETMKWGEQTQKHMDDAGSKTVAGGAAAGGEAKEMLEKKFAGGKSGQGSASAKSTPDAGTKPDAAAAKPGGAK